MGSKFAMSKKDSLRLRVFTDSSFVNSPDYSRQIGFVVLLSETNDSCKIVIKWLCSRDTMTKLY